mmetsp:Transcript_13580/g.1989  ORF Transcript_13580/g.1989 Transcript_13580/m.1989 type:complete len:122 (+) Transcript_13580:108-473(+)
MFKMDNIKKMDKIIIIMIQIVIWKNRYRHRRLYPQKTLKLIKQIMTVMLHIMLLIYTLYLNKLLMRNIDNYNNKNNRIINNNKIKTILITYRKVVVSKTLIKLQWLLIHLVVDLISLTTCD